MVCVYVCMKTYVIINLCSFCGSVFLHLNIFVCACVFKIFMCCANVCESGYMCLKEIVCKYKTCADYVSLCFRLVFS